MIDSMTAEVEVLEFIATLVTTIKPRLVVETGSFLGISTEWIARGLERNGFGKVISCEFDPVVYARAKERLDCLAAQQLHRAPQPVQPGDEDRRHHRPLLLRLRP